LLKSPSSIHVDFARKSGAVRVAVKLPVRALPFKGRSSN
jgi:hypothetical protein